MIRAALEGVLYNLYTVYLALIEVMNETPNTIKATGGFAKSEIWRQMMADILILILSCQKVMRVHA